MTCGRPAGLPGLLKTDVTILGTPLFEHPGLTLRGCPDGIDAAGGALYPIEIKSHRVATRLDRLELAFYWLLLEPQRTRRRVKPAGVLILRRDGQPFRVDVPITDAMLGMVREMIGEVRAARRNGVTPRVCGCVVCTRARRDEVIQSVTERKDVSMILGVGPVYSAALEKIGYSRWDTITDCDPGKVVQGIRDTGAKGCGPAQVRPWQMHARAFASGLLVLDPEARWPVTRPYIALDLEYDTLRDKGLIWLTGAAVVDGTDAGSDFAPGGRICLVGDVARPRSASGTTATGNGSCGTARCFPVRDWLRSEPRRSGT